MNKTYAKIILYSYPCCDSLTEQIDELVEKRALSSMRDFSPCEEQCFKILELTDQKRRIIKLKSVIKKLLGKFCQSDLILLDYRYFKKMPAACYEGVDFFGRKYFRRQDALITRFCNLLEKAGLTDAVFEEEYLSIEFFREMKRREEKRSVAYAKKNKFVKKEKLKKTNGEKKIDAVILSA